ncbi:DUF2087 domain-containing protein [Puerhibacterium sp. TATVAM-FAB25]|uniref:DUF2087 domain-containing protein n=1 Tax=Puerhibacterium sp. TATVAM-FAB25 TaxID=3093699 RepID=UPI00397D52FE
MTVADVGRFFRDGRLTAVPRRWRDRVAVARYVASSVLPELLEPIGERELTGRLAAVVDDPVAMRRALVDLGLVQRARDGSVYWRGERTEHDDAPDDPRDVGRGDVARSDVGHLSGGHLRAREPRDEQHTARRASHTEG